jgi:hypothetical protein
LGAAALGLAGLAAAFRRFAILRTGFFLLLVGLLRPPERDPLFFDLDADFAMELLPVYGRWNWQFLFFGTVSVNGLADTNPILIMREFFSTCNHLWKA